MLARRMTSVEDCHSVGKKEPKRLRIKVVRWRGSQPYLAVIRQLKWKSNSEEGKSESA